MGIWTEIKHAINSTLGTSEFKPLDKIIEGQRTLAASDSVIQVVSSEEQNVGTSGKDFGEFIPKKNGSVRILAQFKWGSVSSIGDTLYLRVRRVEDDTEIGKNGLTGADGMNVNEVYTVSLDINVDVGVQYKIQAYTSNKTVSIKSMKIGAQIIDTSLVEVI